MTPIERLCRTLYTTTGKIIKPADLQVQDVRVNDNPAISRNTTCTLLANENGRLKGSMAFYYNRLNLDALFHGSKVLLTLPFGSRVTTQLLAQQIGERFGVDLLGEDVEQSGEYYLNQFPFEIVLTAVPGSYAVTGSLTVTISDAGSETSNVLGVPSLDGLNSPTGDFTRAQGVLWSWFWTPPSAFVTMIKAAPLGTKVAADILSYVQQMDFPNAWVNDDTTAVDFNLSEATLVYLGNRDDNANYSLAGIHNEIAVIQLGERCANIAGDLVINLS